MLEKRRSIIVTTISRPNIGRKVNLRRGSAPEAVLRKRNASITKCAKNAKTLDRNA